MSAADDDRLDPAAVAALYAEHGEELTRFLHGVLRDPQLAADAVQVAFVKVLEVGHTSRSESRKSWLFRVAYNEALAIRRRQGVGQRAIRRLAWRGQDGCESADAPLVRRERAESVREALRQLPDNLQQIVRMRIDEDKTFAQIAAELNIPLGTALTRMRSALAKLRECLREGTGRE